MTWLETFLALIGQYFCLSSEIKCSRPQCPLLIWNSSTNNFVTWCFSGRISWCLASSGTCALCILPPTLRCLPSKNGMSGNRELLTLMCLPSFSCLISSANASCWACWSKHSVASWYSSGWRYLVLKAYIVDRGRADTRLRTDLITHAVCLVSFLQVECLEMWISLPYQLIKWSIFSIEGSHDKLRWFQFRVVLWWQQCNLTAVFWPLIFFQTKELGSSKPYVIRCEFSGF